MLAGIIVIASILVGALLYWLVESPFMAIRARRFPTSFAEAGRDLQRTLPATAQAAGGEY
jgi:peptidoglycan/LPS O-acetylase OafA/YrhL